MCCWNFTLPVLLLMVSFKGIYSYDRMSVYTPPIIQQIFMNVMASKTYSIANICFHLEVSPISMMRSCVMLAAVNFEPFTLYNTHRESAYPNALRSLKAGGNVRLTPIQHVLPRNHPDRTTNFSSKLYYFSSCIYRPSLNRFHLVQCRRCIPNKCIWIKRLDSYLSVCALPASSRRDFKCWRIISTLDCGMWSRVRDH